MSFVHAQQKVMHTIYSPKYYRNIIIIQSRLFDNSVRKYNKMTSVVLNGSEKSNVGENDYHRDTGTTVRTILILYRLFESLPRTKTFTGHFQMTKLF